MHRTGSLALLAAFVLLVPSLLDDATSMTAATRAAALSDQAAGAVRFGRVTTASEVRSWGNYVVKSEFLPGDRVWVYAETFGTVRTGRVDMTFRFQASAGDGKSVYDSTAEFNEPTRSANWGAWREFALPARAAPGPYTLRVDVLNRLTGERGTKVVEFAVVSAARTLPVAAPPSADGEADVDTPSTEPLSPEMEEAFALLRLRQHEAAVRMFRKALGQDNIIDGQPAKHAGATDLGVLAAIVGAVGIRFRRARRPFTAAEQTRHAPSVSHTRQGLVAFRRRRARRRRNGCPSLHRVLPLRFGRQSLVGPCTVGAGGEPADTHRLVAGVRR